MPGERDVNVRLAVLENSHAGMTSQRLEDRRLNEEQLRGLYKLISNMKNEILNSVGALDDKLTEKIADLDEKMTTQITQTENRAVERIEPLESDNKKLITDLNRREGAFKFGGFLGNFFVGAAAAAGGVVATLKWGK